MKKPLFLSLFIVFIINFSTQPKDAYIGDPMASQAAAISLINSARMDVPESLAKSAGERGQFFVQNTTSHKWFSKYGVLTTWLFTIPLYAEKLYKGKLTYAFYPKSKVFFLNMFNLLFLLGVVCFLFKLAALFSNNKYVILIFVLTCIYSTYLWNYTRAQSSEIFQLFFMLLTVVNFIKYKRNNLHINLVFTYIGLFALLHLKLIYLVLFPLFIFCTYRQNRKSIILYTVIILSVLIANYIKFGHPLETGYRQWFRYNTLFSGQIVPALIEYLIHPQWSMFLHFPLLIIGLFGARSFFSDFKNEIIFIWALALIWILIHASFVGWRGEWCYGPRFLLPILPIAALPCLKVYEFLLNNYRQLFTKVMASCALFALIYSTSLQINVNSVGFLTKYKIINIMAPFGMFDEKGFKHYFRGIHEGVLSRDFLNYKKNKTPFYPLKVVEKIISPQDFKILSKKISEKITTNYFLF